MKINCITKAFKPENYSYSDLYAYIKTIKSYNQNEVNRLTKVRKTCFEVLPVLNSEEPKNEQLIEFTIEKTKKIDYLLCIYHLYFRYSRDIKNLIFYYCSNVLNQEQFNEFYNIAKERLDKYLKINNIKPTSKNYTKFNSIDECMNSSLTEDYKNALNIKFLRTLYTIKYKVLDEQLNKNILTKTEYDKEKEKLTKLDLENTSKLTEVSKRLKFNINTNIARWFVLVLFERLNEMERYNMLSTGKKLLYSYVSKNLQAIKNILYKKVKIQYNTELSLAKDKVSNFMIDLYGVFKSFAEEQNLEISTVTLNKKEIALRYNRLYKDRDKGITSANVIYEKLKNATQVYSTLIKIDDTYRFKYADLLENIKIKNLTV